MHSRVKEDLASGTWARSMKGGELLYWILQYSQGSERIEGAESQSDLATAILGRRSRRSLPAPIPFLKPGR